MTATLQPEHTTAPAPVTLPSLPMDEYREIVARMQAAFPAEAERIGRAITVLLTSRILTTDELGVYLIQCSAGTNLYYRCTSFSCTCPDRLKRGIPCKHSHALTVLSVASAIISYQQASERYELTTLGRMATRPPVGVA